MQKKITELREVLSSVQKIVITTHHKPDGDAMGSSLGLYNYLILLGHSVRVITPTDYPMFLHWLPGNADVWVYTDNPERADAAIAEASLIFCLDFNHYSRINEMGEKVRNAPARKVLMDHHLDPENFDDYRLWDANACATAELVYDFIVLMGGQDKIDKHIASCLYTGIMTDSGSFRFPSTSPHVHRVIAELIEAGADNARIHEQIYENVSETRLRFLGHCLKEKLKVFSEYRTALIYLSKEELNHYSINTGDTEGIVNYALSINGIIFAALIIERKDKIKLSFRSKGEFPANEIAAKFFDGGGHRNAAGGQSDLTLDGTLDKFISVLNEYKQLLNQ